MEPEQALKNEVARRRDEYEKLQQQHRALQKETEDLRQRLRYPQKAH